MKRLSCFSFFHSVYSPKYLSQSVTIRTHFPILNCKVIVALLFSNKNLEGLKSKDSKMDLPFVSDLYPKVSSCWPSSGKVILGSFDSNSIILYQAYNPSIAEWAVSQKTFLGCPDFSLERMTWVKSNFLWMMFRSGWATKINQERILAISIKREGFEEILRNAKEKGRHSQIAEEKSHSSSKDARCTEDDDVRLQWDPDHDPHGLKVSRRAIQLGIRGKILEKFLKTWIIDIVDITDFVKEQYKFVQSDQLELLKIPAEEVYSIADGDLRMHIGSDA